GDYQVVLWKAAWTHAFHPNVSHPNQQLAALFDTPEFREALSISINRPEMNDLIYNGLLEPRQASPVSRRNVIHASRDSSCLSRNWHTLGGPTGAWCGSTTRTVLRSRPSWDS
ncbi:MAG: hypothetical protein P8Y25_12715, partial [Chromatiaceae bacterium]